MKKNDRPEPRFAVARRGYDVEAVESYILAEQAKASEVQMEQKERIIALKTQCAELTEELASLRSREEQIKSTLVTATEKAEKMNADVKTRYLNELERLRLFRAKWTKAYEEMSERYHFSKDALNMESVAVSTELEIQKFLSQDFSIDKGNGKTDMEQQFRSEIDRLTKAVENPDQSVRDLREKLQTAGDKKTKPRFERSESYDEPPRASRQNGSEGDGDAPAAFSIDDALTPKESLAEICQYLGLGN